MQGTKCRNAWQLTSVTCIRNKSFSIYLHLLTWILNRDTLVNLEMCFSCLIYMCASLTYIMCGDVAFFLLDGKLSCKVTVMVTTLVAVAVTVAVMCEFVLSTKHGCCAWLRNSSNIVFSCSHGSVLCCQYSTQLASKNVSVLTPLF